jgi:hypothetical protein
VGSSGAANFSTNTSSSVAFDDGTKLYVGRFLDSTLPLVDLAVAFTSTSGGKPFLYTHPLVTVCLPCAGV